jgi:UDP-glucose 4-epimerase
MQNRKRVIVTGGAGFIGSHIVQVLIEREWEVIILDNLSSGKLKNIEPFLNKSSVKFIEGSVTNPILLRDIFGGVDYVFHQAAIPSVPKSIENPISSHDTNVTGTLNVLIAARDNKIKKVVFASSSSIYGDSPVMKKQEDMIGNPQSPYAASKFAAECYCNVFTRVYGLPTVCLRYFNVYGPNQDPNSEYAAVIPSFIQKILEGKPPVIFGDGLQSRDFIFVRDIARANLLAVESGAVGVFNIGTGVSVSLNSLSELMIKIIGTNVEVKHENPRPGDIRHSLADIFKAQEFGFMPNYQLEFGLMETIKDFQTNSF